MSIFLLTYDDESSVEIGDPDSLDDFLSELSASPTGSHARLAARVRAANGGEIPVTNFTLRAPAQSLGCALDVTLARAVDFDLQTTIDFDIGVYDFASNTWAWINYIKSGVIASRDFDLSWGDDAPRDSYTLSIVDTLADRWQRAPAIPEVLYDPTRTEVETGSTLYRDGFRVDPIKIAIGGLSLYDALTAAYVQGCGFAQIKTNIPNFPVERVDFSLEGGYHAGVSGFIAAFEPVFVVVGNTLWILDGGAALPNNFTARDVSLSVIESLNVSKQEVTADRLIVIYQDTGGDYYTERLEYERKENGRYGNSNYTETNITRRIREYRHQSDPTRIIRETVADTTTEVHAGQSVELAHREKLIDRYDASGRKTGHTRTVESRVPRFPTADLFLIKTMDEQCSISYAPHPFRPSETIQALSVTEARGMILEDNDNQYLGKSFKLPYTDAHRNGFINQDADQRVGYGAIRTTIESVRARSEQEVDVQVTVIDHIAATTERSTSTPRTGDVGISKQNTRNARSIILTRANAPTNTRAETFNAGALPSNIAVELGSRKLRDNPPRELRASLARFDPSLRRGVIISTTTRDGAGLGNFALRGFSVTGEMRDGALTIKQSIEAREVQP